MLGKKLVEQTAKQYSKIPFDIIYVSPLVRTVQTANIMNKFHNIKIVKDKRLIEIDQGVFTGRLKSSLTEKEIKLKASRDKSCKMESYQNVFKRTKDFLDFVKQQSYNNVLIITHNIIATTIADIIQNKDNSFNRFQNAEIKKFEITNNTKSN